MSRKKPRSPGVSLGNRAAGFNRWLRELRWEGGKAKQRRSVRAITRAETRHMVNDETATASCQPAGKTLQHVMVSNNDRDRYPAYVDPNERHDEGYVKPHFDLDTVRELAATTQADAGKFGHGSIDTVHVVDGDEDGEPPAVVVVVTWMRIESKGVDGATTIVEPIRYRGDDDHPEGDEDASEWLWPVGGFPWCWYAFGPDGIHPQIPYQPEQ